MAERPDVIVSPFKPGGLFVNPDGTLTGDGYRFLDQLWKRVGGFNDQVNSSELLASLSEQFSLLQRDVRNIGQDIESLRGVTEDLLARKVLRSDIVKEAITDAKIAPRADILNNKILYPTEVAALASDTSIGTTEALLAEVEVTDADIPSIFFFANSKLVFDDAGGAASSDSVIATWRLYEATGSGIGTLGPVLGSGEVTFTTFGGVVVANVNSFPPTDAKTLENTGTVYLKLTLQTNSGTANVLGNGTESETNLRYVGFGRITK